MQRIGYVVTPGFTLMGLTVMGVFEMANRTSKERAYQAVILSEHGGPVRSACGVSVETAAFDGTYFDTVIIGGGLRIDAPSPNLIEFLRVSRASSRRVASTCSGAFFLARAGILDRRRATTHWRHVARLRIQYPAVKVEADCIYVVDGPVWTSAGMTAGFDLAFGMIEKDLGGATARSAAKYMMVDHRRARTQSQSSALLELNAKSDRIQAALVFAKKNLHTTLSIGRLAEAAHLSPRQFCRRFLAETGQLLKATFRESDVMGRIGGDEFAVVGHFSKAAISAASERLQAACAAANSETPRRIKLSFSAGHITTADQSRAPLKELLASADRAMYEEKRRKKVRVR